MPTSTKSQTTRRSAHVTSSRRQPPPRSTPADPEPTGSAVDRRGDEEVLLAWLAECRHPGAARHPAPDAAFSQLLVRLSGSTDPLPADLAGVLALGRGATIGDAATELLLAVNNLGGPRCRSYRAAVLYLQGDPGPLFDPREVQP